MKARGVPGVLGRTAADGSPDPDPTNRIRTHLSDALNKPSETERMVFIDLNAADGADGTEPPRHPRARRHLLNKERDRPNDPPAYVFITNFCYHHHLASDKMATFIMPFGFHIPDFMKSETSTLFERYKEEEKHADALAVVQVMEKYTHTLTTFDGSLPSELPGMKVERRPIIGKPYHYDPNDPDVKAAVGVGLEPFTGIVTTALAVPQEMAFLFAVQREDGHNFTLWQKASERQMLEWEPFKDTYFGVVRKVGNSNADPYELFVFFVENHRHTPREKLLEWVATWPDAEELRQISDEDLLLKWAERVVNVQVNRVRASQPNLA
ncbi:MAG: hypothetical protein JWR10_907 [Rubritepida sp.]|nr:hypothetical protein [Rubritepida sp.]